jgi:hypothetical protein
MSSVQEGITYKTAHIGDLIVEDDEVRIRGGDLASNRNHVKEILDEYVTIIEKLLGDGLEGEAATALREKVNLVKPLGQEILNIGMEWENDCKRFVEAIDVADERLY